MRIPEYEEILNGLPQCKRTRCEEILKPLEIFCARCLNDEYLHAARELIVRLCAEHEPAARGLAGGWAAGAVQALGNMNFLSDPLFSPCLTIDAVADFFGVSTATVNAKMRVIRDLFGVVYPNREWMLEHALPYDETAWLHCVDGRLIDFRKAPRDAQKQAFKAGVIPYIYADRHGDHEQPPRQVIARIGPNGVVTMDAEELPPANADQPLGAFLSKLADMMIESVPEPPRPKRRAGKPEVFTLKIALTGTKPPIYRRLAVKSNSRLSDIHDAFQAVMGWHDCHMHEFRTRDDLRFGNVSPELDMDGVADERKYRLHDLVERKGDRFFYTYDFGDDWDHRVELVKVAEPEPNTKYPLCIAGQGACPPEDCGGVWGYYEMLDILDNPAHERYEEYREWLSRDFDPDEFDVDLANQRLAHSFS